MATLTPTFSLTSTDVSSDSLSLTTTDTLSVTASTNVSRKSIATGSAQSVLGSNSSFSYVYLKVISSTNSASWVQVLLGGDAKFKVRVGEFLFIPLYNSQAITAEAQTAACVIEYAQYVANV
jgi:hypothetical protein|tara:strand:+ start:322 stop:687 length:366 start_codon:yes stop_codon:yes gene_type:complete